jgi:N-acyl-D-amino-acid deacylase
MSTSISRRNFIKTTSIVGTGLFLGISMKHEFDLIIRNGLIVDGTGSKPYIADIGIADDKIIAIGDLSNAEAQTTINAAKNIVCPGFIDIHTHTDIELLVNNHAESKIHQGVTTEVSGNCGSSPFPFNDADAKEYSTYQNKRYGIDIYWKDLNGFF